MEPLSIKKRRFYFYTFTVLFLLGIPVLLLYAHGYRLTRNWQLLETGGVYVTSSEFESRVFIAGELEKTNLLSRGILKQNLKPGHYWIEVQKKSFFPSVADIVVEENFVSEYDALLIPIDPIFEIIPKNTTAYTNAASFFRDRSLATSTQLARESLGEFLKGETFETAYYYPGRFDVVVFSTRDGVFVAQMNNIRNIFPLYHGSGGVDVRVNGKNIYIKDGTKLVRFEK